MWKCEWTRENVVGFQGSTKSSPEDRWEMENETRQHEVYGFLQPCLAALLQRQSRRVGFKQGWSLPSLTKWGFPPSSVGKESACNAGDPGSITGLGRSPGQGNGNPLQYSCLENPKDKGVWRATEYGVARVRHDWVTKHAHSKWDMAGQLRCMQMSDYNHGPQNLRVRGKDGCGGMKRLRTLSNRRLDYQSCWVRDRDSKGTEL